MERLIKELLSSGKRLPILSRTNNQVHSGSYDQVVNVQSTLIFRRKTDPKKKNRTGLNLRENVSFKSMIFS
jgi:hypothetical protein